MNPALDPAKARNHLAALLSEECALLGELETQLEREYQLLKNDDVDGMEAAGKLRHATISNLFRIEDERRHLCQTLGYPQDIRGVQALIAWCDPQATLLPVLTDYQARATRCRELNLSNGALVNTRLHRVSTMLRMLDVTDKDRPAYGPNGAGRYGNTVPGRVFNASA